MGTFDWLRKSVPRFEHPCITRKTRGQSEWVIFVLFCFLFLFFFYFREIGKEFLGIRMNESISLRFQLEF